MKDLNETSNVGRVAWNSEYNSKPTEHKRWLKEYDSHYHVWEWKCWVPAVFIPIFLILFMGVFVWGGMSIENSVAKKDAERPSTAYVSGDIFFTSRGNAIDMDSIRSIEADDSLGFVSCYYVKFVGSQYGHNGDRPWEISRKDGERLIEAWKEYRRGR